MSPSLVPTDATHASRPPLHEGRPRGDRQRQLLLALVSANPGVHILRAAALLGLNWNTCLHHVRRLEGSGLVTVRKVNGRVCLFDRRGGSAANRLGTLMLRDERNAGLARLLIESPGINQKELAGRLGVAASVAHYRLVRLEEAGLVQRVNRGREVAVFPTEALEAAVRANLSGPAFTPSPPEAEAAPEPVAAPPLDLGLAPAFLAGVPLPSSFDVDAPVAGP